MTHARPPSSESLTPGARGHLRQSTFRPGLALAGTRADGAPSAAMSRGR